MSLTAPSTSIEETAPGDRLDELITAQEAAFRARQPRSRALIERASRHLAGGATSNWQIASPHAVWLSHGSGSKIYDVDGTEYVDLHGGYGVSLAGHAHPAVVAAIRDRAALGTHFAQPTVDAIDVAENLTGRFGLPQWRYANSGTEATMDAVHLMRAITGRDLIIKVEGCYHGHHDSVEVSVLPEPEDIGPADAPTPVAGNTGIPAAIRDLTLVVAFNDLDMVRRVLEANPGRVAGMILEPVMMNAGIILPRDGYLAGLKELLHAARRAARLRRGQDRVHGRPGRRHRAVRRDAGHPLPGQGPRRRDRLGRHRRHGRGHGRDRRRPVRAGAARSTATRWRWPRPRPR